MVNDWWPTRVGSTSLSPGLAVASASTRSFERVRHERVHWMLHPKRAILIDGSYSILGRQEFRTWLARGVTPKSTIAGFASPTLHDGSASPSMILRTQGRFESVARACSRSNLEWEVSR
jgi:hypothetical protein